MKLTKRILALVLCAALVLGLCACEKDPVETTVPPTTTTPPTTVPTEPPTEPTMSVEEKADLYTSAVEALSADDAMTLQITMHNEVNVAGETLTSSAEQTVTYVGMHTETPVIHLEDMSVYGSYEVETSEIYADGMVYATVNDYTYSVAVSHEEFVDTLLPAALINAALYASIEVTEDDTGMTLVFSQPSAIESWLASESAQIDQVNATARLDSAGALVQTVYSVEYSYGGNHLKWDVTVDVLEAQSQPEAPANVEDYILLESLEGPQLMEMAYGYLMETDHYTVNYSESYVLAAAGFIQNIGTTIDSYGEGDGEMMQTDQSIYQMVAGETFEMDFKETFQDGKYSSVTDDERPETNTAITSGAMRNYITDMLLEYLPELAEISGAKATHLGSVYLVEFTLSQETADSYRSFLCSTILSDPTILDSVASKYEDVAMEFYLSVDCYTQLPVAMGIYFEGCHTISGEACVLSLQADYDIDIGSLSAYKNITEETAPDIEPEEKATPLFYHVTGENGQEMWLFGTIHVGDDRTAFLPQEIYDAFAASDALAIECDTKAFEEQAEEDEEIQEQISDAYYYSDGSTTKDHISDEELYEKAVRMMKATGNNNMNLPYMKPYLWGNFAENFFMRQGHNITGDKGVEERLLELAEEQGKPVREVESTLFQMQMITSYSDELQEMLLEESITYTGEAYWQGVQELFEMWCTGNEEELIEYLNDDEEDLAEMTEEERKLYDEYNQAMMVDRNAGMLDVAKQYLESGDVAFYAVGLAHLLAEDGLVNTLREAGYTVELVQYSE